MVKRITYPDLPEITGPYVHATKHCDTLYISGLTAFGTPHQSSDFQAQTRCVLEQITRLLEHEGLDASDLLKLTIFVTDIKQLSEVRAQLFAFYGEALPACSLVEVSRLIQSDLMIEIECIAALRKSD